MMDARTLEALKASIAKWEENVAGGLNTARVYGDSCPLCALFYEGDDETICAGCPVAEKANAPGCNATPWRGALDAFLRKDSAAFRAAAREEVAFLKSLLPEEAQ